MSYQGIKRPGGNKCISLNGRGQYEKAKYYITSITWHSGKGKTMRTMERSVVGVTDGQAEHREFSGY